VNTLNVDYQECLYRSCQSYDLIAYAINESNGRELFKYCLINEQECFIRFKATSAQREQL
jgi:hypothetical protein